MLSHVIQMKSIACVPRSCDTDIVCSPLRLSYQKEAIAVLEGMKSGSMKGSRTKKKQSYTAFQESLQEMWSHAVLFANSIPLFEGTYKGCCHDYYMFPWLPV